MKALKNIAVGFAVSFLGSLPLGYLNIVGVEIYRRSGLGSTVWFALGVITIEMVAIYLTLIFATKLIRNVRLMRFIEGFSILFLFALAFYFFPADARHASYNITVHPYRYPSYLVGAGLSCVNFMQLPFWTGWNVYVLHKKYIRLAGRGKILYVAGTAAGTFAGMMAFIFAVYQLATTYFASSFLYIVSAAFALLGLFQAVQFWRRYVAKTIR